MNAGALFSRNSTGTAKYDKETDIRKVTLIETQLTRVKLGGVRVDLYNEDTTYFRILPSLNVQHIFQKTTFNLIERDADRFQYENSNLETLQVNTSLDMFLKLGNNYFTLGGSYTPWDTFKESGFGFDSIKVSEKVGEDGDPKNEVYQGSTGEYEYNSASNTLYWDAKFEIFMDKLFVGYGFLLGAQYKYFSYEFDASASTVEDAAAISEKKAISQTKQDMIVTFGVAPSFIKLGKSTALLTTTYSLSRYNEIIDKSKTATSHTFGFGITFKKF
jgi:hypothetical protein